jgi:hypothetical protein
MRKLILLSVIIAAVVLPARAAAAKNAKLGLRRALWGVTLFNLAYLFALLFVVGRF